MLLYLHDTLSNKLLKLRTDKSEPISIYNCGITVYSRCHIGHGRSQMTADILVRYLNHLGYSTNYVRNITDIDDKIITASVRDKTTIEQITSSSISSMYVDLDQLNLLRPDCEPRATGYIKEIIVFIQDLITKGYAYINEHNVFFHVSKYQDYGMLSKRLECKDIKSDPAGIKHNTNDFALWKKDEEYGYDSPWGKGRPGWHIECSAMSTAILGEKFDIHLGGSDLIFPHHENEIAQSCARHNKIPADIWLHTGLVAHRDNKISKSDGAGTFYLHDLLEKYGGNALRYYYLIHAFGKKIEASHDLLQQCKKNASKLLQGAFSVKQPIKTPILPESFYAYMDNNLSTHKVIQLMHTLASERDYEKLYTIMALLGFDLHVAQTDNIDLESIKYLLQQRAIAKRDNNYQQADVYRETIRTLHHMEVSDQKDGSVICTHTLSLKTIKIDNLLTNV